MICGFFCGGGWTLSPFFWVETENGRRSQGPQPFKLVQKGKKLQHKSCEIKSKIKNFYNNVSLDRSRFSLSINAAFVKAGQYGGICGWHACLTAGRYRSLYNVLHGLPVVGWHRCLFASPNNPRKGQ